MIKYNEQIVTQNHFPDGTLLAKVIPSDCQHSTISWYYENDAELFTVICLAKQFRVKRLFLPYVPHARQDRIKKAEDIFTLKWFAEVINSLHFEEVTIFDVHSNVSLALINKVSEISPATLIKDILLTQSKDTVLFFPDEGAVKRYADMMSMPYAYGIKKRDWATGNILGLDIVDNGIDLNGKDILIIDDICSRGGTFYHSAKKLKELGAKDISLYITHCENTILEGELLDGDLIKQVFTTNSIFTKSHEKITILEV